MFGALTFGDGPFGAEPFNGPLLIESSSTMQGQVTLAGVGSALALSSSTLATAATLTGSLSALISSSGVMSQGWSLTPKAVAVWNSQATLAGRADVSPKFSVVRNAVGTMVGSAAITGYQLRAYDQLFPASVSNNDVVQIGKRLYIWKASLGRWAPGGPAGADVVLVEMADVFASVLAGASRSIVSIPETDTVTDLVPVYERNLQTGYSDALATIPDSDEVADLAEVFETALA